MKINAIYILFALIILLLLAIAGIFIFKAYTIQNDVIRSEEHRFRSIMLAIELFQSSEDLTRMARSYVSNGDTMYEKKYFEILDIRNGKRPRPQNYSVTYWHLNDPEKETAIAPGEVTALQDLIRREGITEKEFDLLRESQANSDRLVNLEKQAFAALKGLYDDGYGNLTLRRKPDRNYAVQLLYSEEYVKEKAMIMTPIHQFMVVIDQRTKDELSAYQAKLQQYIVLAFVFIGIVICVVFIKFRHTFYRILYPIGHLRDQVAEIASGNFSARCDVCSGNEIGELCVSFNSMADSLQTDFAEQKRVEHQVKERIKELKAFYNLSEITEREGITLDEIYQELTNILPQSWQYPEICCARILINDNEFHTKNFKESTWMQSAPIKIYGSAAGKIDIGYLEEKPKEYEGPFLKEERMLLDAIAEQMGHITERKQTENEIKQSEEKLKEAQRIARMGNWELDIIENKLLWSDGIYELFEIDPMQFEASYEAFLTAIHPDDREMVNLAYTESIKKRIPYEISHRLLMKDGRIKWVNEICHTEYDSKDSPVKSFGIVQDITERKKAEEALRETRDYLDSLFKYANAPIITWNPDFTITRFNEAFERITGRGEKNVTGKNIELLFPEETKKQSMEYIRKAVSGEKWETVEIPIKHVDGTIRILLWNSANIYGIDGRTLVSTIAQGQDITVRKQAELALQKSTEERELLIKELQHALNNVKTLQGLIPICANCKKIRDDKGYWNQVEGYLVEHTDAKFTHGLCPECGKKLYGDLYESAFKKSEANKNK